MKGRKANLRRGEFILLLLVLDSRNWIKWNRDLLSRIKNYGPLKGDTDFIPFQRHRNNSYYKCGHDFMVSRMRTGYLDFLSSRKKVRRLIWRDIKLGSELHWRHFSWKRIPVVKNRRK